MLRNIMNSKLELTPKEIVAELDRYVIGQQEAKRAVAIALRNRWRRNKVQGEIKDEIIPHNILMVGPTGCGKTEIARRMAKMVKAPFLKVEATKFTEVGYVGRDVESIIRDLLDNAINMVRCEQRKIVEEKAAVAAEATILTCFIGDDAKEETKRKYYEKFKKGELDDKEVSVEVSENKSSSMPTFDVPGMPGSQMGVLNIGDMLGGALGGKKKKKVKLKVQDAYKHLLKDESDNLLDEEQIIKTAISLVENEGIVFLDEIDKIAARSESRSEVNREGVQRDLLPLIEGTVVNTKHGIVNTDHILFVASGAFHLAKPSDLLPELQGRLPIRVELNPLTTQDLIQILTEPEYSLTKQYSALFEMEGVVVEFVEDGIESIAKIAADVNKEVENIGARRLHTIIEKLFESLNFTASETPNTTVVIDSKYVENNLSDLVRSQDLSQFIL